jgi:hypothetical protein
VADVLGQTFSPTLEGIRGGLRRHPSSSQIQSMGTGVHRSVMFPPMRGVVAIEALDVSSKPLLNRVAPFTQASHLGGCVFVNSATLSNLAGFWLRQGYRGTGSFGHHFFNMVASLTKLHT